MVNLLIKTRSHKALYILKKFQNENIIYPTELCEELEINRRNLQEIIYQDVRLVLEEYFSDYGIQYNPSLDIYLYKKM